MTKYVDVLLTLILLCMIVLTAHAVEQSYQFGYLGDLLNGY